MKHDEHPRDDAEIRDLLTEAGHRPAVPAEDLEAIKAASREEWRRRYGKPALSPVVAIGATAVAASADAPGTSRGRGWWLAAASVLLALALGWSGWLWWNGLGPVAEVVLVEGTVVDGASAEPVVAGQSLRSGAVLVSRDGGRLALRLNSPESAAALRPSLRLAEGSEVELLSGAQIALHAGAIYIDSPPSAADRGPRPGIRVRTALGSFQEIGTQFEVRILPGEAGESVRLRVREGAVEVVAAGAGGATQRVEGGEALRLHADGSVERSTVGLYGGPWQWIEASAPPFPLREAPLRVFLEWYCRETGLGLEFRADPAVLEETVSGDFTGMTVEETLATALLSSRLSYHRGGDTLVVEEASELPADP